MRHALIRRRVRYLPREVAGSARRLRFHFGETKRAGARPDIVTKLCGCDLRAVVVDDAQRSAGELAASRAFDADLEAEALTRRDRGRQAPDTDVRRMSHCGEGERSRALRMPDAILFLCG